MAIQQCMISRNHIILICSVAAVAACSVIYLKNSNEPVPRPESVQSVMPTDLSLAIAEAKPMAGSRPAEMIAKMGDAETGTVFERTGINKLQIRVTNSGKEPMPVHLAAGTVFESHKAEVFLIRSFDAKVQPEGKLEKELTVISLSSKDQSEKGTFTSSTRMQPKLAPLIQYLELHPEVPAGVVQTAALAILEDAPAGMFARFQRPIASDVSENETYRVNTCDMVSALQLLRNIGVESSKLGEDAQLKVEAMIDPAAHDIAMQYYGIRPENEWAYWRNLLLEGDPTMRHYALYGIARFYPDVAMKMMPKWALETRTSSHYRRAAIGALALTNKSEARQLLQALGQDLAKETDLAQRVDPAIKYLEQNLPNSL